MEFPIRLKPPGNLLVGTGAKQAAFKGSAWHNPSWRDCILCIKLELTFAFYGKILGVALFLEQTGPARQDSWVLFLAGGRKVEFSVYSWGWGSGIEIPGFCLQL